MMDKIRDVLMQDREMSLRRLLDGKRRSFECGVTVGALLSVAERAKGKRKKAEFSDEAKHCENVHEAEIDKIRTELLSANKEPQPEPSEQEVEAIAKAIADAIGHGMREKCFGHAKAAIAAIRKVGNADAAIEVDIEPAVEAMWDEYRKSSNTPEFMKDVTWTEAVDYASKEAHWAELVRTGREQARAVAKLWDVKIKGARDER